MIASRLTASEKDFLYSILDSYFRTYPYFDDFAALIGAGYRNDAVDALEEFASSLGVDGDGSVKAYMVACDAFEEHLPRRWVVKAVNQIYAASELVAFEQLHGNREDRADFKLTLADLVLDGLMPDETIQKVSIRRDIEKRVMDEEGVET